MTGKPEYHEVFALFDPVLEDGTRVALDLTVSDCCLLLLMLYWYSEDPTITANAFPAILVLMVSMSAPIHVKHPKTAPMLEKFLRVVKRRADHAAKRAGR